MEEIVEREQERDGKRKKQRCTARRACRMSSRAKDESLMRSQPRDYPTRSRQVARVSRGRPRVATCRRNVIMAQGYYEFADGAADANTRRGFRDFHSRINPGFPALGIKRGTPHPPLYILRERASRILTAYSRRDPSRNVISRWPLSFCRSTNLIRSLASRTSTSSELSIRVVVVV